MPYLDHNIDSGGRERSKSEKTSGSYISVDIVAGGSLVRAVGIGDTIRSVTIQHTLNQAAIIDAVHMVHREQALRGVVAGDAVADQEDVGGFRLRERARGLEHAFPARLLGFRPHRHVHGRVVGDDRLELGAHRVHGLQLRLAIEPLRQQRLAHARLDVERRADVPRGRRGCLQRAVERRHEDLGDVLARQPPPQAVGLCHAALGQVRVVGDRHARLPARVDVVDALAVSRDEHLGRDHLRMWRLGIESMSVSSTVIRHHRAAGVSLE